MSLFRTCTPDNIQEYGLRFITWYENTASVDGYELVRPLH